MVNQSAGRKRDAKAMGSKYRYASDALATNKTSKIVIINDKSF